MALARARFADVASARDRLARTVDLDRADRMAAYGGALQEVTERQAVEAKGIVRMLAEGDSWFETAWTRFRNGEIYN